MTYTLTVWGPVATSNGMSSGPVDSAKGLSDRGVLEMFDAVLAKGGSAIITDEDGFYVDPRELGWIGKLVDESC